MSIVGKHSRNASGQIMTGAGSNAKPLLPFDLNNLITLSHSFELLKDTLEYLAANMEKHKFDIIRLSE